MFNPLVAEKKVCANNSLTDFMSHKHPSAFRFPSGLPVWPSRITVPVLLTVPRLLITHTYVDSMTTAHYLSTLSAMVQWEVNAQFSLVWLYQAFVFCADFLLLVLTTLWILAILPCHWYSDCTSSEPGLFLFLILPIKFRICLLLVVVVFVYFFFYTTSPSICSLLAWHYTCDWMWLWSDIIMQFP